MLHHEFRSATVNQPGGGGPSGVFRISKRGQFFLATSDSRGEPSLPIFSYVKIKKLAQWPPKYATGWTGFNTLEQRRGSTYFCHSSLRWITSPIGADLSEILEGGGRSGHPAIYENLYIEL